MKFVQLNDNKKSCIDLDKLVSIYIEPTGYLNVSSSDIMIILSYTSDSKMYKDYELIYKYLKVIPIHMIEVEVPNEKF